MKDIYGIEIQEGDSVSLWYTPLAAAFGYITLEDGELYFNTTEATPNKALVKDCIEWGNDFTVLDDED